MFTRFAEKFYLTRDRRPYALGCAAIVVLTSLVTVLIMIGLDTPYTLQVTASSFTYWVICAGALGGAIALYLSRGWMGALGALGFARAVVGSLAIAVIASIVAGTLIEPAGGTVYAPLLMVSTFLARPWIAAIWFAGVLGAHYLMSSVQDDEEYADTRPTGRLATEELSALSRANLYRRN
ncbi:hypothetical protein [Yoonia sp.]|uniref:hypothetical protein n=1 Tax=Yoonia sp. TaxID=2212373 RepID=UPI002DFE2D7D|nr:hypothetical protein [Yoonia sp.]